MGERGAAVVDWSATATWADEQGFVGGVRVQLYIVLFGAVVWAGLAGCVWR
jgi:hypothetical protein